MRDFTGYVQGRNSRGVRNLPSDAHIVESVDTRRCVFLHTIAAMWPRAGETRSSTLHLSWTLAAISFSVSGLFSNYPWSATRPVRGRCSFISLRGQSPSSKLCFNDTHTFKRLACRYMVRYTLTSFSKPDGGPELWEKNKKWVGACSTWSRASRFGVSIHTDTPPRGRRARVFCKDILRAKNFPFWAVASELSTGWNGPWLFCSSAESVLPERTL